MSESYIRGYCTTNMFNLTNFYASTVRIMLKTQNCGATMHFQQSLKAIVADVRDRQLQLSFGQESFDDTWFKVWMAVAIFRHIFLQLKLQLQD